MDEPATDPEALDEELAEYEGALDDVDSEMRELVAALRAETDRSLRLAVQYSGEEWDLVFAREDVRERYVEAELERRVETLVLKGHGDPPEEASLRDFGTLDAVMRWYDGVVVAHFPAREWSGFVFTFDREASPIVDLADQHLGDRAQDGS